MNIFTVSDDPVGIYLVGGGGITGSHGVEDFVDHLTPAYKFLEQTECDPNRHTVAKWCGLKGHVQDMIDAGEYPRSYHCSYHRSYHAHATLSVRKLTPYWMFRPRVGGKNTQ